MDDSEKFEDSLDHVKHEHSGSAHHHEVHEEHHGNHHEPDGHIIDHDESHIHEKDSEFLGDLPDHEDKHGGHTHHDHVEAEAEEMVHGHYDNHVHHEEEQDHIKMEDDIPPVEHHVHTDDEPIGRHEHLDLEEEQAPDTHRSHVEDAGAGDEERIGHEEERCSSHHSSHHGAEDKEDEEMRDAGEAAEEEPEVSAVIIQPLTSKERPKDESDFVTAAAEELDTAAGEASDFVTAAAEESSDFVTAAAEEVRRRESGDGEIEAAQFEEVTRENAEDEEKPIEKSEIVEVLKLFDHDASESIDVKDIGNVLRCLHLNPTESEVKSLVDEFESEKIPWSEIIPKLADIVSSEKYKPATEDELITAFSLLDTDKKGFLTIEQLKAALLKLGEPLNEEEFEEMLATAADVEADCFNYVEYAKTLVCN